MHRSSANLAEHVRSGSLLRASSDPLSADLLDTAQENLRAVFDPTWGGFGRAPKFPPAPVLEFLLRRGEEEMTRRTLDAMAAGGMHDLVGGGFHRYSVDARWLVPHFEKMLYDNALLASVYVHAATRFGDAGYREIADRTLDYLERELALDGGGFASAQDADTDGVEGLTFTWAPGEGAPEELFEPFEDGRFVLRGELDADERARLLAVRADRPQPFRDDKAIASWNGLTLAAFAQAGRVDTAVRLAEFLLGPLSTADGRLHRTWRDGVAKGTGYLEDYADVAYGLMELHTATAEPRFLLEAYRLAQVALALFADDELGGFFQAPVDGERLVARKKEVDDHPTPSGNAMLAYVLLRLARIWGDDELERRGVSVLRLVRAGVTRSPTSFGWMLVALDQHLAPHRELAIVGDPHAPVARRALADAAPTDVIAFGPAAGVPLLEGRTKVDGKTAVYVCERFACSLPLHLTTVVSPTGSGSGPRIRLRHRLRARLGLRYLFCPASAPRPAAGGRTALRRQRASRRCRTRARRPTCRARAPRRRRRCRPTTPARDGANHFELGCMPTITQPATISTGRKPTRSIARGCPPAPRSCERPNTSPAAATSPDAAQ